MSLVKNISIYAFFSFLEKGMFFILMPILTYYLSPEEYGIVANYETLILISGILILLGTHGAINVEFFRLKYNNMPLYISSGFVNMCFAFLILFLILFFTADFIERHLQITYWWVICIPLIAFTASIIDIALTLFQAKKEAFNYGISSVLKISLYFLIALFLVVFFEKKEDGIFFSFLVSNFTAGIILFTYLSKKKDIIIGRFNRNYSLDILYFGLPLVPHSLGHLVINSSDRFFISSMVGVSELGIYHIGYTLGTSILLISTVFNKAWIPFLFGYLKENSIESIKKVKKISLSFILLMFFAAFSLTLIAPIIFDILIDESYALAIIYVPWVAFTYAIKSIYLIFGNFLFYIKKTTPFLYVSLINIILNLVLNYFLIQRFSTIGAIYATLISNIVFTLLIVIISHRLFPIFTFPLLSNSKP